MIEPPFAAYHRAELERLVREGFEKIEREAAAIYAANWQTTRPLLMDPFEFLVLMAADAYLRSTKAEAENG